MVHEAHLISQAPTSTVAPIHPRRLSVAPMLCVTDGPYRTMARLLSRHTLLYTEMLPADVILAMDDLKTAQQPIPNPASLRLSESAWADAAGPFAVQLGGADPGPMAEAARRIVACFPANLVEININCGCPSGSVAQHSFGASLMRTPDRVQSIAAAVRQAVPASVDVTVKMRLGVDDHDTWEQLVHFVKVVSAAPATVTRFIVHARKAILGLNTADNRLIPPLRREWVAELSKLFPGLTFEVNGGVRTLNEVEGLLSVFHGVMVGRAARDNPWGLLGDADTRIFGCPVDLEKTRRRVVQQYAKYADTQLATQLSDTEAAEASGQKKKRPHERRELRKRLYRPLFQLFCDCQQATQALKKCFERNARISSAAAQIFRVVGSEVLDTGPSCSKCNPEERVLEGERIGELGMEDGAQCVC